MSFEEIRDKDRVVLECIAEDSDDIQLITETTTLNNSAVNYCFRKLSDAELIATEKPDGMVDRVVNGTRQVFEAPKKAQLTAKGREFLEETDRIKKEQYRKMTRRELVERVHELEEDIEDLKDRVENNRQHISDHMLGS